jgi:hypothetical protein
MVSISGGYLLPKGVVRTGEQGAVHLTSFGAGFASVIKLQKE